MGSSDPPVRRALLMLGLGAVAMVLFLRSKFLEEEASRQRPERDRPSELHRYGDPEKRKAIEPRVDQEPCVPRTTYVPRSSRQEDATPWYAGGSLHRATMREWFQAPSRDRLATAADFVARMYKSQHGTDFPHGMGELKRRAQSLVAGIDQVDNAPSQSVASIAAGIAALSPALLR